MSRDSADSTVKSSGHDGAFVVRQSQKGGVTNPFTLTLLYATEVYNLHIRLRSDGKFAIGKEKPEEIVSRPIGRAGFLFVMTGDRRLSRD